MSNTLDMFVLAIKEQFATPKADLEHNLKALLSEWISKMDVVTREELERQQIALNHANQRLAQLQQQVQHLMATIEQPESSKE